MSFDRIICRQSISWRRIWNSVCTPDRRVIGVSHARRSVCGASHPAGTGPALSDHAGHNGGRGERLWYVSPTMAIDRGMASGLYLGSYFLGGLVGAGVLGKVFDAWGWPSLRGGRRVGARCCRAARKAPMIGFATALQRTERATGWRSEIWCTGRALSMAPSGSRLRSLSSPSASIESMPRHAAALRSGHCSCLGWCCSGLW